MKRLSLLVSPQARSAFFAEYLDVALAELAGLVNANDVAVNRVGGMDFLELDAEEALLPQLAQLSFLYGIFERGEAGLCPLPVNAAFNLHADFVFGSKYRGKTNEILTQLLINVGLQHIEYSSLSDVKLLDPMCGRGTTLLWAMRYGMKSRGIEQDVRALADIRQNVKKWCKVHRQKHRFDEGFIGKANKQDRGRFVDFSANDVSMRVVAGDSSDAVSLLKGEKFQLLVSDLPYGVQHFTTDKTRNPLAVLQTCAQGWSDSLKPGGAMVLAFNNYMPRRAELIEVFANHSMQALAFTAAHRMSESIVRDVVVLKKTV